MFICIYIFLFFYFKGLKLDLLNSTPSPSVGGLQANLCEGGVLSSV